MQASIAKTGTLGRKAKLANSYRGLLDEFSSKDLKSVGNYTVDRLVGKGSFGKVYLATHKLINASKVVLKSAKKDDGNLAREIHHHRQFIHPHIARLYEIIVTESLVWMVLEYCPGDELYNYLLEHGPLPVEKVQRVFAQLVGAVTYVHQQSCVHRDLKLENILFDKNENVKLVDFGFTREYDGKTSYLQTFCGTVCYSAPEMIKGEKYAGEKVDVWSLGVILYALFCGELPFDDDDEMVTRTKILTGEPKFPKHIPEDAQSLLKVLLSKRPLLRPTLPDILHHPFLVEHAPAQLLILDTQLPSPFSTTLEKDTLQRMRSAGVNIDAVIESVLGQRCDALAGWWGLLLEKEERKMRRRDQKRRERELENRNSRRFSTTSSRLERLAAMLPGENEEGLATRSHMMLRDRNAAKARGRSERRSAHYPDLHISTLLQPGNEEKVAAGQRQDLEGPPPPIDKDSVRSASALGTRQPAASSEAPTFLADCNNQALPFDPPSTTTGSEEMAVQQPLISRQKVRRRPSQAIIAHWKQWTHWFYENTRRHKSQHRDGSQSAPNLVDKLGSVGRSRSKDSTPQPESDQRPIHPSPDTSSQPPINAVSQTHNGSANPMPTTSSISSTESPRLGSLVSGPTRLSMSNVYKRQSLSPSPMTPRSVMRRSSTGLLGRNSTSSSVSSVRSTHNHHNSHSKASSISSGGSASNPMPKSPIGRARSPHHSVKVLPLTPFASDSLSPNARSLRARPSPLNLAAGNGSLSDYPSVASPPPGSPSPFGIGNRSVLFAKRKRNLFKGPMLGSASNRSGRGNDPSRSRSRSANGLGGRLSSEITIHEVDEDYLEEGDGEDVEEVDHFSPIGQPGEKFEEVITEDV